MCLLQPAVHAKAMAMNAPMTNVHSTMPDNPNVNTRLELTRALRLTQMQHQDATNTNVIMDHACLPSINAWARTFPTVIQIQRVVPPAVLPLTVMMVTPAQQMPVLQMAAVHGPLTRIHVTTEMHVQVETYAPMEAAAEERKRYAMTESIARMIPVILLPVHAEQRRSFVFQMANHAQQTHVMKNQVRAKTKTIARRNMHIAQK